MTFHCALGFVSSVRSSFLLYSEAQEPVPRLTRKIGSPSRLQQLFAGVRRQKKENKARKADLNERL